jgi:endonuclease III
MILFWRYFCTARNPRCKECKLKKECLYYNWKN